MKTLRIYWFEIAFAFAIAMMLNEISHFISKWLA